MGERRLVLAVSGILAAGLVSTAIGCGSDTSRADRRQALEDYVAQVQPIRLGINELLDRADPVLEGYRDRELSAKQAQRRIERIERGAADYAVRIAAAQVLADRWGATLPADLQVAGRGEISPSPTGD